MGTPRIILCNYYYVVAFRYQDMLPSVKFAEDKDVLTFFKLILCEKC